MHDGVCIAIAGYLDIMHFHRLWSLLERSLLFLLVPRWLEQQVAVG